MSVTAGVSEAALATRAKLQGGIGQTRVGRYWPGRAPKWAEEAEEDHDDDVRLHKKVDEDLEVSSNKDDPRLRRLAQTTKTENREQVRADHQRVRQAAEVISTEEDSRNQEEEEDVDALEERRNRIREKNLKRAREEADLVPVKDEEEEEEEQTEEEGESEYETDSEYEGFGMRMIKPVFVPKAERETVAEREKMEAQEAALEELAKKKLEMRKIETKQIVVEEVRKDEEMRKNMLVEEANIRDVDTDDEINEAEQYEVWKTRETARIKREKDAKEAMSREKEEIDKLRNMTEQERKEWERDNPKPSSSSAKPKRQFKFMQRYYHKGAFFQEPGSVETDGIYQRDYSAPTGEDRFDKTVLREVMQVKKFGRSGRTKWTHLTKEDTTYYGKNKKEEDATKDWNDPWVSNGFLRQKFNKRMAAMDAPIERPKGSKKMKVW